MARKTILLLAQVSKTPATVAAFHPEVTDVFLLGHLDGSVAAYRGGSILRGTQQHRFVDREICQQAELGRLKHALRTSLIDGAGSRSFTGAVFLPGQRYRAAIIGSDCRCRLIEFNHGTVLRT